MDVANSLEISAREGSTFQRIKDRLPTYLADFREDPSFLLMFVLARTMPGRHMHRLLPRARHHARLSDRSMFAAPVASVVEALRQDGIYTQLVLPQPIVREILHFAETTPCFGNHDRNLDLTPAQHIAQRNAALPVTSGHYFERIENCPGAMAIQSDPLLHGVAQAYLGRGAQVISNRLWWSFPALEAGEPEKPEPREMLHFDLDDWRMLKFFFYLTRVDAQAGPHLYMRGSHRRRAFKHQFSLTVGRPLAEITQTYGKEHLMTVVGQPGSGIAEDPFGYHAGSLARTTPRLMLELGFGVTPPNRRRFFGERIIGQRANI